MYRHLQSGEVLEGRFRMVMQVKDALIVRADEYRDHTEKFGCKHRNRRGLWDIVAV